MKLSRLNPCRKNFVLANKSKLTLRNASFTSMYRISGNMALEKDIHASVSAQMKKTLAKSRWKVKVTSIKLTLTFV